MTKKVITEPTLFRMRIKSRHKTHFPLRRNLPLLPFRSIMRLGSTTEVEDTITNGGNIVEINTIQSVKNSANKRLMKECFTLSGVKSADWFLIDEKGIFIKQELENKTVISINELPYPIVAKNIWGSRGTGNHLLHSAEELIIFCKAKDTNNYIFEKFYNYNREYRLHITEEGCFYTCRKMLKKEIEEKDRWYKNDSNSVWILEDNETFDKPTNWNEIVAECVKALEAVELDIGSFDVRVQSSTNKKGKARKEIDYIIIESNSASSFGLITTEKYLEMVPRLARKKAIEYAIIK